MVRCCSGHQPLAMYGRRRKGHVYMTCDYGRTYGKVAADQIEGHGQWLSVREDVPPAARRALLRRAHLRADAPREARRASCAPTRSEAAARRDKAVKQLREQVADLDRRIGAQIEALERGVEPALVQQAHREAPRGQGGGRDRATRPRPVPDRFRAARRTFPRFSRRIPDLSQALRDAPPELKRQVFEAFGLRDRLRQGRAPHRDLGHHHRGRRARRSRRQKTSRRRSRASLGGT
ncbi:MAG: hypothetical protein WKF31_12115 [Thermoleophilaceae bacterium]